MNNEWLKMCEKSREEIKLKMCEKSREEIILHELCCVFKLNCLFELAFSIS
jgi:hypothetical protein